VVRLRFSRGDCLGARSMQTDSSKQQAEVKSGVRSGGIAASGLLEWRRRHNNRRELAAWVCTWWVWESRVLMEV
jgi:hypothetical protein